MYLFQIFQTVLGLKIKWPERYKLMQKYDNNVNTKILSLFINSGGIASIFLYSHLLITLA